MKRLDGKVVFLTGATGGIGGGIARRFLAEGARLMLVGRSEKKLKALKESLDAGGSVATFETDAADEQGIADAVKATVDKFGGLHVLVANAGTEGKVQAFDQVDVKEFESVMSVNVTGVWLAMKHAIAPMRECGGTSMIAISSVAGMVGSPGIAAYVASKHAVYGLVKSVALELGESGIRVNAIAPGPIDNRMIKSIEDQINPSNPDAVRAIATSKIALNRYGTNDEVANLALFLASDESSFSTGAIFPIDGGMTAA